MGGRIGAGFKLSSFLIKPGPGLGEFTAADILRPRSNAALFGKPADDPTRGFLRKPELFPLFCVLAALVLSFVLTEGMGDSVEFALPPIRKVIFGVGSGADILSLSLGC